MKWFIEGWKSVGTSRGRTCRRVYWWFTIGNGALLLLVYVIEIVIFRPDPAFLPGFTIFGVVYIYVGIVITVRRLHDIGKSGWYYLLILIPTVGELILFFFTLRDSEPGSNQWGPNPKEPTHDLAEVF